MFLLEWWDSLGTVAQFFSCVAIPSTLILLVQTIFMFIGIGNDSDGAGDPDVEDITELPDADLGEGTFDESVSEIHDISEWDSFRIFTIRGIIAFLVVFGWIGVVMDTSGVKLWITLPVATVCGFAMMVLLALLFRMVMKFKSSGNTDNKNAVGVSGKVHLTIPPARTGEGKVHLMLQGSYVERNAVTDSKEAIPTGCEVVVIGISGQTDLVVKIK